MNEKIFCTKCGGENRSDYSYCVFCGAELIGTVPTEPVASEPISPDSSPCSAHCDTGAIVNMPIAAAKEFIGNKATDYIPKFTKMDSSKSSLSWNWPVALFSFLLGMPFIWFFYRKMYKVGAVLLAICTALTLTSLVCAATVIDVTADVMAPYLEEIITNPEPVIPDALIEEILSSTSFYTPILSIVSTVSNLVSILNLALCIYISIAANGIYMKHMLKSFNLAVAQKPEGLTAWDLRAIGGTSSGAAVAVAIGFALLCAIAGALTVGASFMNFFMQIFELTVNLTL